MSAEAMQSMAKSAAERVKNDFEIAGKKLDQEQDIQNVRTQIIINTQKAKQ